MPRATLTNNLQFNVKVIEGNAGIFRTLQVLEPGQSLTIEADQSITYREYVAVQLPGNKELRPLSSDDILDLGEIEIYEVSPGIFSWREQKKAAAPERKTFVDHIRAFWGALRGRQRGDRAGGGSARDDPAAVAQLNADATIPNAVTDA